MDIDPNTIKLIGGGVALGFGALWREIIINSRRCEKDRKSLSKRVDQLEHKIHSCPYPCNLRDTKEPDTQPIKVLPRVQRPG